MDIRLEDISKSPLYAQATDNASRDIIGEAEEAADAESASVEFTLAKILLAIINEPSASEGYAERKSEDYRAMLDKESLSYLIKIAREDFGMKLKTEDSLRLHFIDFLRDKPDFLKLSQADMLQGYVQVSKSQLCWVLKGAIKRSILDGIPKNQRFPESLEKAAQKIKPVAIKEKRKFEDRPRISSINENALPPCIRDIIGSMEAGRANHNAHFVLVAFLHGLNLDEKAMLDIFRRSAKFKEKIALYQIRFSKERGYTCPACSSIKGYGLCTGECPRGHPVSNYFLFLKSPKANG
jgi:DNA primase large subunit